MEKHEVTVWRAYCREREGGTDYAPQAVRGGYVAFGGDKAGPATDHSSKASFVRAYTELYADGATRAGQIWRLLRESRPGDWVLMAARDARRVHVGRMLPRGYYFEANDADCRFGHRFAVEWLADLSYERARDICGPGVIGRSALGTLSVDLGRVVELLDGNAGSQQLVARPTEGKELVVKDGADVQAIVNGGARRVRQLHNQMTNALMVLCRDRLDVREGVSPDCMYDALVCGFDGAEDDLLVEVKSTTERGVLRLAVGQLLDYRRGLRRREQTSLAVLLPSQPDPAAIAFLRDVDVRILWFADAELTRIVGDWCLGPAAASA